MRLVFVCLAVFGAAACVARTGSSDADVDDATQHVESAGLSRHFAVAGWLTGAEADAQRATGVVLTPIKGPDGRVLAAADGTPIRGTCGATFVSRRHAITASHCVPASDLAPGDPVTVQLVDVTADVDWRAAAKLSGRFPAFETRRATRGYRTTDLTCTVKSRCGAAFGPYACPLTSDHDIALLECDELPAGREPVAVAASDDARGPVTMLWFHEIYDAPGPSRADAGDTFVDDFNVHYTLYSSVERNFHYFGGDRNQIFPLVSRPWSATSPRRRLGEGAGGTVMTDLFACHGTSGSGVFEANARTGRLELLGPVATGGRWASYRLCADPDAIQPGELGLSYTSNDATRAMAALAR